MLSVPDLLMAGTISLTESAFLMKSISEGASFLVGAKPGGAGKTTVMCALLNFLPIEPDIIHTENTGVLETRTKKRSCFLCHEIGRGNYFSYLWGRDLTRFFGLAEAGHTIASNLHADTYEQARQLICIDNPVSESAFDKIDLLIFMETQGSRRKVTKIYSGSGAGHISFEEKNMGGKALEQLLPYSKFLSKALREKNLQMPEFRKSVVNFFEEIGQSAGDQEREIL